MGVEEGTAQAAQHCRLEAPLRAYCGRSQGVGLPAVLRLNGAAAAAGRGRDPGSSPGSSSSTMARRSSTGGWG